MAALLAIPSSSASHNRHWRVPLAIPDYAQGTEAVEVRRGAVRAAEAWRGPSAYIGTLVMGRSCQARTSRVLAVAGLLFAVGIGLLAVGFVTGGVQVYLPAAGVSWLGAYAFFTRWVARHAGHSELFWYVERVLCSIAYEGDPGPRPQ